MSKKIKALIIHIFLAVGVVAMLFPFLWMISTSLKSGDSIFEYPPQLIPKPAVFKNYIDVFIMQPTGLAFINSMKIAVINTLGVLFTSSLAAYGFAKLRFKGKQALFIILLATMMIPSQITLIPMFILFKDLGWIDTHLPLIVPAVLCNAYGVFLLRQFFMTIPDSYCESAKVDGCTQPGIYFKIMLPLCKPALTTLGLFSFMSNWNNFLTPLIFLNTREKFTLPLIIMSFQNLYNTSWNLLMATSAITLLPIIIIYLFSQKYFIQGVTLTGIKG